MDSILHLVGIAKKAGRLEVGEEPVGAAARARQAKLILVASDAAENTVRRASHFAQQGNVPWLRAGFTKVELGGAVGRASCALAAVTEIGLACALCAKLAQQEPERYGETARALEEKAQKALQRQKEQRRHEKNLLKAKRKPWAAPAAKPKARPRAGGPGAPAGKRPAPRGIVSIRKKQTP